MDQTDPAPTPPSAREERISKRLESMIDDERLVAWAQGWVSREVRLHRLLAARTLDFAVLTDRSLFLVSTGFFTRRPRRRVYAARLDEVFVSREVVPTGRRLRITAAETHPLWIELHATERDRLFAATVVARARAEQH